MRFAFLAQTPSPDLAALSRAGAKLLERRRQACASKTSDANKAEYSTLDGR
ncbi:uncharacterized protein TrAFT101_005547 [Trichoderma asperellum]|uniref:uncharacterized protein n=1 Tax=Trichoderma asperellum TaxID=101201 RepID=UPI003333A582|nr:hypothetical protein TrAFT101_005547 [Trichoderma asperellum]